MTYDDDYIQLETAEGTRRWFCRKVGLTWPPPEHLWFDEVGLRIANSDDVEGENQQCLLVRESMSIVSDEQRAELDDVRRGALYRPAA